MPRTICPFNDSKLQAGIQQIDGSSLIRRHRRRKHSDQRFPNQCGFARLVEACSDRSIIVIGAMDADQAREARQIGFPIDNSCRPRSGLAPVKAREVLAKVATTWS